MARTATRQHTPTEAHASHATLAYETPTCGRAFAAQRLALGISANALAVTMGVWPMTLLRWEASTDPNALTATTCARWQMALASCAAQRRRDLARAGLTANDLPRMPLADLLALYAAMLTSTP